MLTSPRLQFIADNHLPNAPLWDVACDHGYLGLWGIKNGLEVHFVDPSQHAINVLKEKLLYEENVHFYCTKMEEIAIKNIYGTISICGVGDHKIVSILKSLETKLTTPYKLILITQTKGNYLREYLKKYTYREYIVNDGKYQRPAFIVVSF